ncbi:hypothetical protein CKO14_12330 [Halorhodospira halophila]|nr:hypothetical protein [Halorhodospira halophila]
MATAARICQWWGAFLAAGEAGLRGGSAQDTRNEQLHQPRAKAGDVTMDLEASGGGRDQQTTLRAGPSFD